MATWSDVAQYLRSNYKIAEDNGTLLRLSFSLDDGRSQDIIVARGTMGSTSEEFAVIASFFAVAREVDIDAVLREASEYVVGGIVQYAEKLAVRHAVPLANLDLSELTGPFELVLLTADALEAKYTGTDRN